MADIVGTGHPDGEDRAMPHGDVILAATGQSAAAAGTTVSFAGFGQPVAGYRSLVIVVDNTGAFDIVVTPRWNFYGAAAAVYSEANQTVKAGTKKRLIFQNEADELTQVTYTGQGGASGFGHYIAGSNLDPLAPSGTPDYIILTGVHKAIPSVVGGDSGQVQWNAATYVTNDASLWTFTLDGAGNIVQVKTTKPGRYEALALFVFDAPAALTAETFSASMTSVVGGNRTGTASITTNADYEGMVGIFGESAGAPSIFETDYALNTATTSGIRGQWWWIKRWAL